jgi:hypothetical protein
MEKKGHKLIVKDSKCQEIKNQNYGQATDSIQKVSFEENAKTPDSGAAKCSSIELF